MAAQPSRMLPAAITTSPSSASAFLRAFLPRLPRSTRRGPARSRAPVFFGDRATRLTLVGHAIEVSAYGSVLRSRHGNAAVEGGNGLPWRSWHSSGRGRDRHRRGRPQNCEVSVKLGREPRRIIPSPDTRSATAPASVACLQHPTPAPAQSSTVRHGHPAIRATALYCIMGRRHRAPARRTSRSGRCTYTTVRVISPPHERSRGSRRLPDW